MVLIFFCIVLLAAELSVAVYFGRGGRMLFKLLAWMRAVGYTIFGPMERLEQVVKFPVIVGVLGVLFKMGRILFKKKATKEFFADRARFSFLLRGGLVGVFLGVLPWLALVVDLPFGILSEWTMSPATDERITRMILRDIFGG